MCGLSLAWVTSENSTSTSNADILSRSSSLDPILSPPVSEVRCWLPLSVVPRQLSAARLSAVQRQLLSSGSRHQLSSQLLSPVNSLSRPLPTSGYGEIFRSKNPLSGFAPKQTKESSALAAHPHSATTTLCSIHLSMHIFAYYSLQYSSNNLHFPILYHIKFCLRKIQCHFVTEVWTLLNSKMNLYTLNWVLFEQLRRYLKLVYISMYILILNQRDGSDKNRHNL